MLEFFTRSAKISVGELVCLYKFGGRCWERGSGCVQSTSGSHKVRVIGRDESQSVPSPEKLLNKGFGAPIF